MYASGWPDVVHIDEISLYYVKDQEKILTGLRSSLSAASTNDWVSVIGYALEIESQHVLVDAVQRRKLSGLAIMVLANQMAEKSLGLELTAAGTLAASVLRSWFLIAAGAARKGLRVANMQVHELLAVCYSIQIDQCKEDRDLASLNRRIFGSSHPWGR